MNKVVYNGDYGGYGLSKEAKQWLKNHFVAEEDIYGLDRHHPLLVQCVEALGEAANDECSCLKVKELKGNKYVIKYYDGWATVIEPDDIEWITIK
jgi:hypothetical protein